MLKQYLWMPHERQIVEIFHSFVLRDDDGIAGELKEKYADVLYPPGVDLVFNFQK